MVGKKGENQDYRIGKILNERNKSCAELIQHRLVSTRVTKLFCTILLGNSFIATYMGTRLSRGDKSEMR